MLTRNEMPDLHIDEAAFHTTWDTKKARQQIQEKRKLSRKKCLKKSFKKWVSTKSL